MWHGSEFDIWMSIIFKSNHFYNIFIQNVGKQELFDIYPSKYSDIIYLA